MLNQRDIEEATLSLVLDGLVDERPSPSLFLIEGHRVVAEAIKDLAAVNLAAVYGLAGERLDPYGGFSFLAALRGVWESYGGTGYHELVSILEGERQKRDIKSALGGIARALDEGRDYQKLLADLVAVGALDPATANVSMAEAVTVAEKRWADLARGVIKPLPLAIVGLDTEYALEPGYLTVIGARAKIGKTALAVQLAFSLAKRGHRTVYYTLEMPAYQLAERVVSQVSGVSTVRLRTGGPFTDNETTRIAHAKGQITRVGDALHVVDSVRTAEGIYGSIRKQASQGATLFVVDYLQLVRSLARFERRDLEVASVTNSLKALAIELGVTVVLLAQINRDSERSVNKRPEVWHLRESGAIEADADMIILIHRDKDEFGVHGESGEIIVALYRHGPTGVFPIRFAGSVVRFENARDDIGGLRIPSGENYTGHQGEEGG